jgi:indole-3-glycerol phosphate synthase
MADFLDVLVKDAERTIKEGYYEIEVSGTARKIISLKGSILKCEHAPVIAEIKPTSPSKGKLRNILSLRDVAEAIERGGAAGISILTEPKHFQGSLNSIIEARKHVNIPILMKDIVIDPVQIEAASKTGANVVLLISSVFERGYTSYSIHEMIRLAHSKGLEVLLETHDESQFLSALKTDADLVGINNRDLKTLSVDLKVTERVLHSVGKCGKVVVSESGVNDSADIRFLRGCGAQAFLVGSAIMLADNLEEKVRELVMAI